MTDLPEFSQNQSQNFNLGKRIRSVRLQKEAVSILKNKYSLSIQLVPPIRRTSIAEIFEQNMTDRTHHPKKDLLDSPLI